MRSTRIQKAFTLAEIMTVVSIIAMITAIAVPNVVMSTRRAREEALRANLAITRAAVEAFRSDTGAFPQTLAALAQTSAPSDGIQANGASTAIVPGDWRGPYLREVLNDPVSGTPMSYTTTSPNVGQVLSSATGNDSRGEPFSSY